MIDSWVYAIIVCCAGLLSFDSQLYDDQKRARLTILVTVSLVFKDIAIAFMTTWKPVKKTEKQN